MMAKAQAGGTLVEVLVAVVMTALMISAITASVRAVAGSGATVSNRWAGHEALASRMAIVRAESPASLRRELHAVGDESLPTRWSDNLDAGGRLTVYLRDAAISDQSAVVTSVEALERMPLEIEVVDNQTGSRLVALSRY